MGMRFGLLIPLDIDLYSFKITYRYEKAIQSHCQTDSALEEFLTVLGFARQLQCSDPKDKVYTSLGYPASSEILQALTVPNYDHAYTFLHIFFDLAKIMINNLLVGLSLITHVAHTHRTLENDFPSWIPR